MNKKNKIRVNMTCSYRQRWFIIYTIFDKITVYLCTSSSWLSSTISYGFSSRKAACWAWLMILFWLCFLLPGTTPSWFGLGVNKESWWSIVNISFLINSSAWKKKYDWLIDYCLASTEKCLIILVMKNNFTRMGMLTDMLLP